MIIFPFHAQFPLENISYPGVPRLIFLFHYFAAFACYMINRFDFMLVLILSPNGVVLKRFSFSRKVPLS